MRPSFSARCCHGCDAGGAPVSRRGWELVAGALSLGVWLLVPKCPLCVAAHVAFWTGLGLSLAAATQLRWLLLLSSGLVLLYVTLKRTVRLGRLAR